MMRCNAQMDSASLESMCVTPSEIVQMEKMKLTALQVAYSHKL